MNYLSAHGNRTGEREHRGRLCNFCQRGEGEAGDGRRGEDSEEVLRLRSLAFAFARP